MPGSGGFALEVLPHMDKVTIEINSKWVRIVRSPLYWIVAALQGLSVSFAPLFLY